MKLYEELSNFSYEIFKNYGEIKALITPLKNEEFFRRLVFSRLYYSLFHKYLEEDSSLRNSTVKIHKAIKEKLKYSNNEKFYQLFVKLYNLRIWADYKYEYDDKAKNVNLNKILYDVHKLIKSKLKIENIYQN